MKLFFLFCFTLLRIAPATPLLILDMNEKKPPHPAAEFSMEQYLLRNFPIYASDLKAVMDATVKAAKSIDRKTLCNTVDTVHANHTLIIIRTNCEDVKNLTVRYVTRITEQNFLCDFQLIKNEEDFRAAQVKLVNFADYMSQ